MRRRLRQFASAAHLASRLRPAIGACLELVALLSSGAYKRHRSSERQRLARRALESAPRRSGGVTGPSIAFLRTCR